MNSEQEEAAELVTSGESILLSGSAGTGKSYTLTKIIEWARMEQKNIGITALTGSAALLIGGRTLHSFLGIGLGTKSARELADFVLIKNKKISNRIFQLDLLIIDEVSMLDDILFEKISKFLGIIRMKPHLPFGGIQIVLCGDFSQNAPIKGQYCFMSDVWKAMEIQKVFLKKLMRQQEDLEFQKILESLRFGKVTKSIMRRLEELKHMTFPENVEPTILHGKNVDVDKINDENLKKLLEVGKESRSFKPSFSNDAAKTWGQSCRVPESLKLCIGAEVILTYNVSQDDGLVNGSRGVITRFTNDIPVVHFYSLGREVVVDCITIENEDDKCLCIKYMPLKLAWAITICKSQGCTLEYCIIDLNSWTYGQAYTAISRARSLKHIKLIGDIKASYFKAHPDVIAFYS